MFPPATFDVSAIYDTGARYNLICLPSTALRATNIAYNKFYRVTSFCNIVRDKFFRVSTFRNIERNKLYRVDSFCHIAQQITSCPPFATLRATAYKVCLAYLRATNIIACLLSAVSATFNLLPF